MSEQERATFLGKFITPMTERRLRNFRANRRGFISLWIFLAIFIVALFAEFIANVATAVRAVPLIETYLPVQDLRIDNKLYLVPLKHSSQIVFSTVC